MEEPLGLKENPDIIPRMSDAGTSKLTEESSRPPRSLVLCFDGTNGQYNSKNTNVVKLYGLLDKDRPEMQVAYYQAGIGTYFAPGVVSPLWMRIASLVDEAVAWYLDAHVMAGYKYLMENYRAGDKICLFGFSRGAYTARALAGMLNKVGLLERDNNQQISFAYKAYTRTDKEGIKLAAGFKRTFSQDVRVEFVGVWDTVESTGVLISRVLPFTDANCAVKIFRQALSLDEHRSRFRPNLYHWPTQVDAPGDKPIALDVKSNAAWIFGNLTSGIKGLFSGNSPTVQPTQELEPSEELLTTAEASGTVFVTQDDAPCTDVLEVWFAGCHSDVGGGNVRDDVEVSLAQIPLHWMVEQIMASDSGIIFNDEELARIGFRASPPSPQTDPRLNDTQVADATNSTVEESQNGGQAIFSESADALAPLFDELKRNKIWWILEFLPFSYAWQDTKGIWHSKWSINFGRGRFIPFHKPKFHHTVKERIAHKPLKYKPRAVFDHNEIYV